MEGDLVKKRLNQISSSISFLPNGLDYRISQVIKRGVYRLKTFDGKAMPHMEYSESSILLQLKLQLNKSV